MSYSPSSPKRRHVLASINPTPSQPIASRAAEVEPERPKVARTPPSTEPRQTDHHDENPLRPRSSRLRLKARRRRRHSRDAHSHREEDLDEDTSSRHRRHGRRRRCTSGGDSPEIPGPPPLDPETAFRESLFDAMADDEAASYWEHVYGQPIHVYPNEKVGPQGELERMTDEEYAAYVRQKMFEKTHAGLLEEKARREEQRERRERERQNRRRERDEHARRTRKLHEMEESLRRGKARSLRKEWDGLWADYVNGWAAWDGDASRLPWPLKGGRCKNIEEDDVRTFFVQGLNVEVAGERTFAAQLKEERVRWHPDKIQQRLGGVVDSELMRNVTAIFQIIDRLWGQTR